MKIINKILSLVVLLNLPLTLLAEPQELNTFTDFEDIFALVGYPNADQIVMSFTIGASPHTATFQGGSVGGQLSYFSQLYHSSDKFWHISNGYSATITFETPASIVQFYAATFASGAGKVEVFDTNNNLLTYSTDFPDNINPGEVDSPSYFVFNAVGLSAVGGISKIILSDNESISSNMGAGSPFFSVTVIDDFGFTTTGTEPVVHATTPGPIAPSITTQPVSQSVTTGGTVTLSVEVSGDNLTYKWYGGAASPGTYGPIAGATESTMTTGALMESTNFQVQVSNDVGMVSSDTATITVTGPVPLILTGSGTIAGEDIQHPNGNIFDQVLLTGESIKLQAKPGHITRVSFMDEDEDIVQVEYSGAGTFTVTLDSSTYLAAKAPPRYNQSGVAYVTGKPSVVIEGADSSTYFSIFTVGKINAVNQALFPEGQEYGAQADVTLLEVTNSTGMGGMQLSNAVFSGSTGNIGIDARGVPIAVRLTVGDIDASGDAVPHLLFGSGSFTVAAGNPGLRITGGDLLQTNGAAVVVAAKEEQQPSLISQNNFKSDHTPQPTLSIAATFVNEDGDPITVTTEEVTIE